ncbi:MAG: response regulator [Polyangiaceae bacterium]|nr:response regulator [Polyangiaceae bacterium]
MICRVLIVDDEADFATALAQRLERRGFAAAVAGDGAAALDSMTATRPDVVLLDVCLPGADGVALLAAVKQLHPNVAVILLTGHASVASGIEGMRLGAFDYLTKPVEIGDLCERILAARSRRGGTG